jgi:5-methylcytosine-specific restriction endonuclease McrA
VLCCVVLCCVVLCCVVLCCVVLCCVVACFISFHFVSFHHYCTHKPTKKRTKERNIIYSTVTLIVATVLTYVARSDLFLRTDVYYIDTVGLLSSCGSCVTVLQTKNVNGNQSTQLAY